MDATATDAGQAAGPQPSPACHGLNLHLQLANPLAMPALLRDLDGLRDKTHDALQALHFVHFARFLPLRDHSALLVVTEFDGPLEAYVLDFVIAIGDVFDAILKYVQDAPPLPVREYPAEFLAFVRKFNAVFMAPGVAYPGEYPLYSAYAGKTVIEIAGPREEGQLAPDVPDATPSAIELADVQGNVLRGFRAPQACHFALRIDEPALARRFLAELVKDADRHAFPRVTNAQDWHGGKPPYMLNVGVTSEGLRLLGVPKALRDRLPAAFREGPADPERAAANGDTDGDEAPAQWLLGAPCQPVHLLLSLYEGESAPKEAGGLGSFDDLCKALATLCTQHQLDEVSHWHTRGVEGRTELFGYREGLSQPRIAGALKGEGRPDHQPLARAGEFLLGPDYESVYGGHSLGSLPEALCRNGTFAAVRVLQQHVEEFNAFLDSASQACGLARDELAARLMGRWFDGRPLAGTPHAGLNDFDYATTRRNPHAKHDESGLICPVGAHIRRMNPRSALAAGASYSHRLMRRGMAYEDAGKAGRGLFGIFLCADLERQFEFLQQVWTRGVKGGPDGTQDPFLAPRAPGATVPFRIPRKGSTIEVHVPKLVTTRGSLYLLMPGIGGLRFLAQGRDVEPSDAYETGPLRQYRITANGREHDFDPRTFDPKDADFLADPYPYYAAFRKLAPVALVRHGKYASYWVFSHELVTRVCEDTALFLKRPAGETGPRGLFFMDPPRHGEVRTALEPLFRQAIAPIGQYVQREAQAAIAAIVAAARTQPPGAPASFDLVSGYTRRVTRNAFMQMFGIPPADWNELGQWIDAILGAHDEMLPLAAQAQGAQPSAALLMYFIERSARCPVHASYGELFYQMTQAVQHGLLKPAELVNTAIHFALGGYLSTDFLVGSAVQRLLAGDRAAFLAADAAGQLATIEEIGRLDAPFQLADRFAAADTELGGCHIPAGARVTVVYGSANRDEAVFGNDADQFDPGRVVPDGSRTTFGHGIHYCIGAPMARQVAPLAVQLLLQQLPGLATQGGERYRDPYFRGFHQLLATC
jgi:cytochrome P450